METTIADEAKKLSELPSMEVMDILEAQKKALSSSHQSEKERHRLAETVRSLSSAETAKRRFASNKERWLFLSRASSKDIQVTNVSESAQSDARKWSSLLHMDGHFLRAASGGLMLFCNISDSATIWVGNPLGFGYKNLPDHIYFENFRYSLAGLLRKVKDMDSDIGFHISVSEEEASFMVVVISQFSSEFLHVLVYKSGSAGWKMSMHRDVGFYDGSKIVVSSCRSRIYWFNGLCNHFHTFDIQSRSVGSGEIATENFHADVCIPRYCCMQLPPSVIVRQGQKIIRVDSLVSESPQDQLILIWELQESENSAVWKAVKRIERCCVSGWELHKWRPDHKNLIVCSEREDDMIFLIPRKEGGEVVSVTDTKGDDTFRKWGWLDGVPFTVEVGANDIRKHGFCMTYTLLNPRKATASSTVSTNS